MTETLDFDVDDPWAALDASLRELDNDPIRQVGHVTSIRMKLDRPLPPKVYDPDTGLTKEEHRRFQAWIATRPRPQPRNVLPTSSWMDWPYPNTPKGGR